MAVPNIFNVNWYLQQNPDIAAAVNAGLIDAQTHFNLYGRFEDRSPSPLFDPASYLESNPDIAEAVSAGLINAYDHFVNFGINEGRNPTPLFDPQFYLQQNPDVAQAMGNTPAAAVQHFLNWGVNEPRGINPSIHLGAYLQSNPDVAEAARFSLITAFDHFATFGITEPRDLGNGVNLNTFGNDPSFQAALSQGQLLQAITRVQEVAPFLPTFQSPPGWEPPPTLPIPLDFIPPQGTQLVIPSGVVVPEGVVLPDVFDPVPLPPVPGDPGGGGGGVTFTVQVVDHHMVSFGGSATGPVTLSMDEDGVLTFTRQGVEATNKPLLKSLNPGAIPAVSMTAETFVSSVEAGGQPLVLAAQLSTGAATLGDVPQNLEIWDELAKHLDKVAENGITGIGLTDSQFSAVAKENVEHFDAALADGALTVLSAGSTTIGASLYSKNMSLIGSGFEDTITGGAGNDIIAGGSGDDVLNGGDGNDTIGPGYGEDTVNAGEGDDVVVIVGLTAEGQYSGSDDIYDDLSDLNGRRESDVVVGELYDGGNGDDTLHIYGTVDLTGVAIQGFENIVVHSDVVFTEEQLLDVNNLKGDGGSTIRIRNSNEPASSAENVDLSSIKMLNVGQLDIGKNINAIVDNSKNLAGIATISSTVGSKNSSIEQADGSATLSFDGKGVFGDAKVTGVGFDSDDTLSAAAGDASIQLQGIVDAINEIIGPDDNLIPVEGQQNVNDMLYGLRTEYTVFGAESLISTANLAAQSQVDLTGKQYELMIDVQNDYQVNAVLEGRSGVANFISGGAGADTLIGADGTENFIYGGAEATGVDAAVTYNSNTIYGGSQRDFIAGGDGADTIEGGGGDDFIYGGGGDDLIVGGSGADFIMTDPSDTGGGADTVIITVGEGDFIDIGEQETAFRDTIKIEAITVGQSFIRGFDADDAGTSDQLLIHESLVGEDEIIKINQVVDIRDEDDLSAALGSAVASIMADRGQSGKDDDALFIVADAQDTLVIHWDYSKYDANNSAASQFSVLAYIVAVGLGDGNGEYGENIKPMGQLIVDTYDDPLYYVG